jgi:hypothetical protein
VSHLDFHEHETIRKTHNRLFERKKRLSYHCLKTDSYCATINLIVINGLKIQWTY